MATDDHYVIIGNGPSGNRAGEILQANDPEARITIISDESVPLYYKHKLTSFIAGYVKEEDLMVETGLDPDRIRMRLGQCVERIDPENSRIFLRHMEKVRYTRLIIAAGGRPGLPQSMSAFSDHLSFLSCFRDVITQKEPVNKAEKFFVIGGDLVGFRFVKMLAAMEKEVCMTLCPEAFWPFELKPDMTAAVCRNLEPLGIEVLANDQAASVAAQNGAYNVTTANGEARQADMVFAFPGLVPNISFAAGQGIDMDHGILVDEYLRTNIDNIYACGSCAQIYNPKLKTYATSVGWPNAVIQGETAALNLLGENRVIEPAPRKFFELEGVRVRTSWWEDVDDISERKPVNRDTHS
ncbi:MAG: FAD-dependent oxidoreductase [Desulfarculaceae bacterium]|nr:FAD-dependent oxidoreductase [Desulfarculaceae bacterium]